MFSDKDDKDGGKGDAPVVKDSTFGYFQGKPVVFFGGNAYPLPAPVVGANADNITETPEEYDAGAEAEAATTAESEGVTRHNV